MRTTLLILMGLPGVGKTVWARERGRPRFRDVAVVSTDDFRRSLSPDGTLRGFWRDVPDAAGLAFDLWHAELHRRLAERTGGTVIADATNLLPEARERLRKIAFHDNARTHLAVFEGVDAAFERNRARDPDARVKPEVMYRMLGQLAAAHLAIFVEGERERYDHVEIVR